LRKGPMKKVPAISVAADHAAYKMKRTVVSCLKGKGYEVFDRGTRSGARSVDYPNFAKRVVDDILGRRADRGILLCGTGIGMAIAANRFRGIRAAVVHDVTTAVAAAGHNRANVLCLGARLIADELALQLIQTWLDTPFEKRHQRRLDLIEQLSE